MSTSAKFKLTIESFSLEVQQAPVRLPPPPLAPKRERTRWSDYCWEEILSAVEHELPGADAAARRRVDGDKARAEQLKLARAARRAP